MKKSRFGWFKLAAFGACLSLLNSGCATAPSTDEEDADSEGYGLTDDEFCKACSLAYYTKGLLIENGAADLPTNKTLEIAEAAYATSWAFSPDSKKPFDAAVSAAVRRKAFGQACDLFGAYLKRHPSDLQARLEAACCADAADRLPEAVTHLEAIDSLAPTNRAIAPLLVQAYYQTHRDADALAYLKAQNGRFHDNASRALLYQWIFHFIDNPARARSARAVPLLDYASGLETNSAKRAALLHQIAICKLSAGQTNGVASILRDARACDRTNFGPLSTLGQLYAAEPSARPRIDRLLRSDPWNDLLFVQAISLGIQRKPAEAYTLLLRYRDLNAKAHLTLPAQYYSTAASLLEDSDRSKDAVTLLREGLAKYPGSKEIQNNLAYLFAQQGTQLEEAQTLVNKALASEPGQAAYLDTKGWILFKMNRPHEALQYLLKSAEKAKDEPEILGHLGDVLEAIGRHADAVSAWKKAYSLDPDPALKAKLGTDADK